MKEVTPPPPPHDEAVVAGAGRGMALSVATGLLARRLHRDGPGRGPGPDDTTKTAPATRGAGHPGPRPPATGRLPAGLARPAPTGFWSGSDSWPVPVIGSGPYRRLASAAPTAATSGWPGAGRPGWAAKAVSSPGPRPTARRPTPTTPGTARASARRSTGSWAAPESTRVTTGPRPRPPPGARGRRRGRWPTWRRSTLPTRSCSWTSNCPGFRPRSTTAGMTSTPRRAAGR